MLIVQWWKLGSDQSSHVVYRGTPGDQRRWTEAQMEAETLIGIRPALFDLFLRSKPSRILRACVHATIRFAQRSSIKDGGSLRPTGGHALQ